MFGLKSRNKKRFSPKVTQEYGPVRARMRRIKNVLVASPLIFAGLGGSIGEQDILSLINARHQETPRWMMALEPANFTSKISPKLALGTTPVPDYTSAPLLTLTSPDKGFVAKPVSGLEEAVKGSRPNTIPEKIATNLAGKSDRLITMAPDRQMVDRASGNLYAMSSLISTERSTRTFPVLPSSSRNR